MRLASMRWQCTSIVFFAIPSPSAFPACVSPARRGTEFVLVDAASGRDGIDERRRKSVPFAVELSFR